MDQPIRLCISLEHEFEFTGKYSSNRHYMDPLFLPLPHLSDVSDVVFWRILKCSSTRSKTQVHPVNKSCLPVCRGHSDVYVRKMFSKNESIVCARAYRADQSTRYLVIFTAFNTVIRYLFGCLSCVLMLMYTAAFNNRQGRPRTAFPVTSNWSEMDFRDRLWWGSCRVFHLRKIRLDDWRRWGRR